MESEFLEFFSETDTIHGSLDMVRARLLRDGVRVVLMRHTFDGESGYFYRIRMIRADCVPDLLDMFVGVAADPSRVRGFAKLNGLAVDSVYTSGPHESVGDGAAFPQDSRLDFFRGDYDKFLESNHWGELRARALVARGTQCMREGRLDAAHVAFQMALQVCDQFAEVHLGLAHLHYVQNESEKCVLAVERAWRVADTDLDLMSWSTYARYVEPGLIAARSALALGLKQKAYDFAVRAVGQAESKSAVVGLLQDVIARCGPAVNDVRVIGLLCDAEPGLARALLLYGFDDGSPLAVHVAHVPGPWRAGVRVAVVDETIRAGAEPIAWLRSAAAVVAYSDVAAEAVRARFPWLRVHVIRRGFDGKAAPTSTNVDVSWLSEVAPADLDQFAYLDFAGGSDRIEQLLRAQVDGLVPLVLAGTPAAEYVDEGFLFRGPVSAVQFRHDVGHRLKALVDEPGRRSDIVARNKRSAINNQWEAVASAWAEFLRGLF